MRLYILLLVMAASYQVQAISISLDLNSDLPGIQNSAMFEPKKEFEIDVVINNLQTNSTVQSYGFNVLFNPNILDAKAVSAGNFLSGEHGELEGEDNKIYSDKVSFSLFALGNASNNLDGVLAKIIFQAKSNAPAELILTDVELADNSIPSLPIRINEINNATVNQVPLPSALIMLLTAIGVFSGSRAFSREQ